MSDFVPTENDLIVNPITGKMSIGKNVDSYEEFINSSKGKSVYTKNDEFYNRLNSYSKEAKRSGRNVHCFSQTPENSKGGFLQGREIEGIQGKKKIFLGGRMIENNFNFHPEQESEKMACFKTMGQYESSEKNGGSNNFQKLMKRLKATDQNKSHFRVQKDEFVSGQGCLKNNDIKGSSPSKFNRGRKLFVDRNSIKTVLGKSPGKYHGFAQDYTHGGTYSPEDSSNIIISDLNSYSKNKITNLNYKSNKGAGERLPNILNRSNLSSEYLLNKSLNKGSFVQGNDVYSNASESKRNHPSLSIKDDMLAYGREQRDHNICKSLATNDRCGSINNMQANNLARSPERGNFSQDKLKGWYWIQL
ncbi:unnamed protein product [Moneuplotes crassus]|uniref:Uncharacterized protein n=1 Tax=Euplotes crassus TaxID=5936 RepID=A0AAD1UDW1_EUPCR|nr:unnamed protein product [Moneuplotes crassus]